MTISVMLPPWITNGIRSIPTNPAITRKVNGYNLNASIDFSRKLNNKGRVFSATLSGGNSDSYSDGMNRSDIVYFNQTDALKNSIIDQRSRYDNKGFNYRAYVSWVEPIGYNNFIQALIASANGNKKP